jgi:hypothetical protein
MQSKEGLESFLEALGHHLTIPLIVKPVNHHPVEPADRPDVPAGGIVKIVGGCRQVEFGDPLLHQPIQFRS